MNSNEGLTFRIDGDFAKFKGIKIDGKIVEPTYYEVKKGSTIITLKPEYLKMFPTGKHKLDVIYTDKEVAVDFAIQGVKPVNDTGEKNIMVQTGDKSNRMSWFILFLASSAIIALVTTQRAIQRRK